MSLLDSLWLGSVAPWNQFDGMSWGELMDRAFDLWCATPGDRTFEEFLALSPSEDHAP